MKTEEYLKASHLGAGLNANEVKALAEISRTRRLGTGAHLFLEGEKAGGFYVLLTGKLKIYKAGAGGMEYTIHRIQPGQMFAEAAVFHGGIFPANCSALEDSLVAFFPRESFTALIERSPQISLKIIASLSSFLREYNQQVENLSLREVPARIASFLLGEADRLNTNRFTLEVSKAEIARSLGTIGETLSRSLKKLREAGVIEVDGRRIEILDPRRLADIAGGEKI